MIISYFGFCYLFAVLIKVYINHAPVKKITSSKEESSSFSRRKKEEDEEEMAFEVVKRSCKDFLGSLLSLQSRKTLCDVTLIVNGKRFFAHSNILLASSKYFQSIFLGSLQFELSKEVTFDNVDTDAFRLIIEYCYTGTIKISEENAKELLIISTMLSFTSIAEASSKILVSSLSVENYLLTWRFAVQGKYTYLKTYSIEYARKNFEMISKSASFLTLEYSELEELLDSTTITALESVIYMAVVNWIKYDKASRTQYMTSLLDRIKLERLPRNLLMSESLLLCESNSECYESFINAHISQKSVGSSSCDRYRTLIAIGSSNAEISNLMEVFDVIDQTWVNVSIDYKKGNFCTVLLNEKLMMIGGIESSAVNTVACYDLKLGKLETYPSMKHPRYRASAVVHNGFVFVAGGRNTNILSSVEVFDSTTKTWTEVASMTVARFDLAVNVLKDKIYVTGGCNKDNPALFSTEVYDVSTGRWNSRAPMSEKRTQHASAVIRDFLYVVGGYDGAVQLRTAERYDPNIDKWSMIQSIDSINTALAGVNFKGKLVVSGGYSHKTYKTKVEMYDESTDRWKPMVSLNKARASFSLIEIPWNLVENTICKN